MAEEKYALVLPTTGKTLGVYDTLQGAAEAMAAFPENIQEFLKVEVIDE